MTIPPLDPTQPTSQQERNAIATAPSKEAADALPEPGQPPGLEHPQQHQVSGSSPAAVAVPNMTQLAANPTGPPVRKRTLADYKLGRTLGEGSYSTVVAAVDLSNKRDYAIKVLDKRHIIREKKVKYVNIEKNVLYKLDHPGVVKLYSTFQDSSSLYYVLELCQNGELLTFIKKLGSFDENCTRFYVAQILTAVEYVHSQGVIHRDLKPENILLDSRMYVKLTDFGTAKILEPSEDGVESDRANSFVGTAEYVSPELLTEKAACKSSDLWALGCIIYQLLAGRPPFKGSNEYQTFQKIVKLEYSFPAGFPRAAMDLVSRLLVHDPNERLGGNNKIDQLKQHPFFDTVQWNDLWKQPAPKLLPYLPPTPTHNSEPLRSDHDASLWSSNKAGEILTVVDPFREVEDIVYHVGKDEDIPVENGHDEDVHDDDDSTKDGLGRDESYIKSAGALRRKSGPSVPAGRPSISSPPTTSYGAAGAGSGSGSSSSSSSGSGSGSGSGSTSLPELVNGVSGKRASYSNAMDASKATLPHPQTAGRPMIKSTSTSAIPLPVQQSANGHSKTKSSSRNAFVALFSSSQSPSSKRLLSTRKSKQAQARQQELQVQVKNSNVDQANNISGAVHDAHTVSHSALLGLQAEHSPWKSFLLPTELIIHQTPVLKRKGFFSKSVILVLTDLPRLLYFDDSSHYFAQLFNSNTNDAFGAWQQKQLLEYLEHQQQQHQNILQNDANGLSPQHNLHSRNSTSGQNSTTRGGNALLGGEGTEQRNVTQHQSLIDQARVSGQVPASSFTALSQDKGEDELAAKGRPHSHDAHNGDYAKVDAVNSVNSGTAVYKDGRGLSGMVTGSKSSVTLAPSVNNGTTAIPRSPLSFSAIKASKRSARLKGEIGISSSTVSELKGKKCFFIHTPRKSYYFEESNMEGDSKVWVKVLQRATEEWFL
ncbi:pkb-activating kinase-like protein [Podila epigama]|nr:pkb-activating kinase-like protein [Podila epigama]